MALSSLVVKRGTWIKWLTLLLTVHLWILPWPSYFIGVPSNFLTQFPLQHSSLKSRRWGDILVAALKPFLLKNSAPLNLMHHQNILTPLSSLPSPANTFTCSLMKNLKPGLTDLSHAWLMGFNKHLILWFPNLLRSSLQGSSSSPTSAIHLHGPPLAASSPVTAPPPVPLVHLVC